MPLAAKRAIRSLRRRGRKPFRGERQRKAKWRERMRDNPYKDLPPLERRPDGSLYRMTPAQRKQAASLIRRECCCCEDGNCIVLDDGDTCTCPQTISFSVCCKWFRWAVLPVVIHNVSTIFCHFKIAHISPFSCLNNPNFALSQR